MSSRHRLVIGALGFLATSFLMSANGNVLPQLFFQRFHPDRKVLFLAACLFVGTCGAIAGVFASRRSELARWRTAAIVLATFAAESSLFTVRNAVAYVALNAAAQFGANYLTNQIDHAAVRHTDTRSRGLYDGASNVARLAGILAGPAFFTRFGANMPVVFGALVLTAAIALASVGSLVGDSAGAPASALGAGAIARQPIDSRDRLLFGYAISVYVALYLFAANLIYLLRDVLHVEDATRRGGTAIVVVFFSALVANAVAAARHTARPPRRSMLGAPVLVLAFSASVLLRGGTFPFGVILAGCAVVGATYGLFLAEVRDRASRGAREEGKIELLTLFNNIGNVSALVAFSAMVALATALRESAGATHRWILAIIGMLPFLATPLLFAATSRRSRNRI